MSWYWYFTVILPALHNGLIEHFGDNYYVPVYHALCPPPVRYFLWSRLTEAGRDYDRMMRDRMELLRELRADMELQSASGS